MLSRSGENKIDYQDEKSIAEAVETATKEKPLDLVIVANGILHDGKLILEKSLKDLSAENLIVFLKLIQLHRHL